MVNEHYTPLNICVYGTISEFEYSVFFLTYKDYDYCDSNCKFTETFSLDILKLY